MDIYEYFNSRDVAAHCKKIGYQLSALEMAYLIWHSDAHTMLQKHCAWQWLMEEMADEELPEGSWNYEEDGPIRKERRLHSYLRHLIEIEREFLETFPKTEMGYVYEYGLRYFDDLEYEPGETFYDSYEACMAALREDLIGAVRGARITKHSVHSLPEVYEWNQETVHMNADLEPMYINSPRLDNDWAVQDGFMEMSLHIPTPFQKGDLVTWRDPAGKLCPVAVLLNMPCWETSRSWEDMLTMVCGFSGDGYISRVIGPHYLRLEFWRERPEREEYILLALGDYMKGKTSLEKLQKVWENGQNARFVMERSRFASILAELRDLR